MPTCKFCHKAYHQFWGKRYLDRENGLRSTFVCNGCYEKPEIKRRVE